MTAEELRKPDPIFGNPIKVGEWLYAGRIPLAVRVLKSDTLYGSGDVYDEPELSDDRAIDCFYLELQGAGDDRWCSLLAFLSLEDIERFGRDYLGGSLCWLGE